MARKLLSCILMVALLLSLTVPARAVSARSRAIVERGIDVSVYQGDIDWDTVVRHVDFVIIRCGFGQNRETQDDKKWLQNVEACVRLKIPFGVYLYSYATTEAAARSEAEHVLRLIKDYKPDLPVYIDVEDISIQRACTDRQILKHVSIFCDIISEAGYTPGVYSNAYWWEKHLNYDEYDQWERWVAQWNDDLNFSRPYSMWQYSSKGEIPGIDGPVDLDYWYGRKLTGSCTHEFLSDVVKAPTCTEEGIVKYTCANCGHSFEEQLATKEHSFVQTGSGTEGMVTYTCSACGYSYEESAPSHEHEFQETVEEATCSCDGLKTYTCRTCGYSRQERIPMIDHSFEGELTPPTCTADGINLIYCTVCEYSFREYVPAKDHCYEITKIEPTANQGGYTLCTCSCGYSFIESTTPCLNHVSNNGIVIKQPTETESGERIFYCKSCGEFLKREILHSFAEHRSQCPSSYLADVPAYMHWAHEGIDLCMQEGWFADIENDRFRPNDAITRATLITALWRLSGSPKPSDSDSFYDVAADAWYAEAVAWAKEQGIVEGLDDGRFEPMQSVTREQFSTFLHRQRQGLWGDVPEDALYRFADADSVNDYAKAPMAWMVHKGYLRGTIIGGTILLDPHSTMTRAQAATILRRLPQ